MENFNLFFNSLTVSYVECAPCFSAKIVDCNPYSWYKEGDV